MLIAEALHLLLTKPDGTTDPWAQRNVGEIAALITDLVVAERVVLTDERNPRVRIVSTAPTGHRVLDAALPVLAQRDGKRLDHLVIWGKLDPKDDVVASLVERGILTLGDRSMFGLGAPRALESNPEPEQAIRATLAAVLAGSAQADIAEATLLGILQGLGVAHRILKAESGGMRARELKKRINAVVESSAAGAAVAKAVQAVTAAVTAAVMVAVTAGGSG